MHWRPAAPKWEVGEAVPVGFLFSVKRFLDQNAVDREIFRLRCADVLAE